MAVMTSFVFKAFLFKQTTAVKISKFLPLSATSDLGKEHSQTQTNDAPVVKV